MSAHNDSNDPVQAPVVVDRATFQARLDDVRVREKAQTREGDAIAAGRRRGPGGRGVGTTPHPPGAPASAPAGGRLPMVEVAAAIPLVGANGPVTLLEAFEGR